MALSPDSSTLKKTAARRLRPGALTLGPENSKAKGSHPHRQIPRRASNAGVLETLLSKFSKVLRYLD